MGTHALRLAHNPPFATTEKKGLIFKPFRFLFENSATKMPQVYQSYRPPKLKKTAQRWYVEYWYRVPEILYPTLKKEWKRFRVFEDINRHKTDEYAQTLLKAVKDALTNGYNPFEEDVKNFLREDPKVWSLNTGLDNFLNYCTSKGLSPNTYRSYQTVVNFLKEYFTKDNRLYESIPSFTKEELRGFFKHYQPSWSGTTYNNYLTFVKAIFNYFKKEEIIKDSPAFTIEPVKAKVDKHKHLPFEIAEQIKREIEQTDKELYDFMRLIYYCAIRPKEIRLLQVKNVHFDRKLLYVPAESSKSGEGDYIPLGEEVLIMLKERVANLLPEDYLFGGKRRRSTNYFASHYKPYKDKYNLSEDHTLYSFKHLRALDLAQAGVDPYQIMRLFRHSSLEITMAYLRDLGLQDFTDIHEKSKRF